MAVDRDSSERETATSASQERADDTTAMVADVVRDERQRLGLGEKEQADALCFSGGGIRSATFSLGVLQGLARLGRLRNFHYLSTVSGGGYIGLWLAAWISRNKGDIASVERELAGKPVGEAPTEAGTTEAEPIRRLRAYSNFLSPVHGLSADSVAIAAIFVRNLLLHWTMVVPILCAVLLLPRAFNALLHSTENADPRLFWWSVLACLLLAVSFGAWDSSRRIVAGERDRRGSSAIAFNLLFLVPVMLGAVLLVVGATTQMSLLAWTPQTALWLAASGAIMQMIAEISGAILAGAQRFTRAQNKNAGLSRAEPLPSLALRSLTAGAVVGAAVWAAILCVDAFVPANGYRTTFALPIVLAAFGIGGIVRAGLSMRAGHEEVREWWGRALGVVAVFALAWMGLSLLVVQLPTWLLAWVATLSVWSAGVASVGGVLLTLATTAVGYWSKNGSDIKNKATSISQKLGLGLMDAAALASMLVIALALSLLLGMLMTRSTFDSTTRFAIERAVLHDKAMCAALSKLPATKAGDNAATKNDCVVAATVPRVASPGASPQAGTANGKSENKLACPATKSCASPPVFIIEWRVQHELSLLVNRWWMILALAAAFVLSAIGCSMLFGANAFSMNSLYGNRLTRAYLGASLAKHKKRPHPFTGFDKGDNLPLKDLAIDDKLPPGSRRLLPVVNTALNLICPSGDRLEWQERKAASFFMSPYYCGSDVLGYVPTASYASTPNGVSVGRAMSVSGAAVSPSMGFHSSPFVTMLLAFFNVRLGWWMPNPRFASVRNRDEPLFGIGPIISELTSRAGAKTRYVYLSDGAHFENLGLYEMVRRRCRRIVIVDAGCDPEYLYEDLENAVRKIRVDFGIRITFDEKPPRPTPESKPKHYWFHGKIGYVERGAAPEDGEIFCIKPLLTGEEPLDVTRYAEVTKADGRAFPQQPTSDQFFDEAQFESYRQLGLISVIDMFPEGPGWPTWPPEKPDRPVPPADAQRDSAAVDSATSTAQGGGMLSGLGALSAWGQAALLASVTAAVTVTGTVALRNPEVKLTNPQVELMNPQVRFAADVGALNVTAKEALPVRLEPGAAVGVDVAASLRMVAVDADVRAALKALLVDVGSGLADIEWKTKPFGSESEDADRRQMFAQIKLVLDRLDTTSGDFSLSTNELNANLAAASNALNLLLAKLNGTRGSIPADLPDGVVPLLVMVVQKLGDIQSTVSGISPRETVRGG